MNRSTVIEIVEYVLLALILYYYLKNGFGIENSILFVAILGFFLFSGSSWAVEQVDTLKEYKKYSIWFQLLSIIILLILLCYVWLM